MNKKKIEKILKKKLNLEKIFIKKNQKNFEITVIDKIFSNLSKLKRQQIIYKPLTKYILNNKIHSLIIKAYTKEEWKKNLLNDQK